MTEQELYKVWDEWHPKVFGYFYRRVNAREDVEDLTSVVLGVFVEKLRSGEEIAQPAGFVWRVAHNQLCKFIRDKSKVPVSVSVDDSNSWQLIDQNVETDRSQAYENKLQCLLKCMKEKLVGQDFTIVTRCVLEDKKSSEVAEECNLKADTVRQKLSRALKKVRKECSSVWHGFSNALNN